VTSSPWIKAQRSAEQGSCVEHRFVDGMIEVRDSKDRSGPTLRFTRAEFAAWLDGARKGEFDHLLGD
jgi:hypothetical protein